MNRVSREWAAVVAAVEFLTRIPVVRRAEYSPDDLPRSTPYFAIVGLIVGVAGGLVFTACLALWPLMLAVVISTAATIRLTGAFHEDALTDMFDGFGGGWNRDQIFRIMKDSRVGAYGVVGLVCVLLAKVLALTATANGSTVLERGVGMTRVLIAGHVLGRWSSLPLIWRYAYVRPDDPDERPGAGKPFAASVTTTRLVVGSLIALVIVAASLRASAIAVISVAVIVTMLSGRYFHKRIGGITGDALGGANQLVELATYLALAAAPHWP